MVIYCEVKIGFIEHQSFELGEVLSYMDSELKPYLYTRFGSTQYEFRFIVT